MPIAAASPLRIGSTFGLLALLCLPAHAADVALSRLDCGNSPEPRSVAAFSDTYAYPDLKLQLTYSCYLVRHGDRYLVWDTGQPADGSPQAPKVSLLDQLGMSGRFASVIGGDTLGPGRGKPAPDMIRETIARCGGDERFAMIGDSSYDVRAAKAAGMPCVVLSFGYNDAPAEALGGDAVIDHYDQLVPALQALG